MTVHTRNSMLLYKESTTQDATSNRFCCWQVSYHADLARASFPCNGKGFLCNWIAASMKRQDPPKRSKTKSMLCRFETQNMSVGCSAGVIHAGTCRG
eukprot:2557092-Amphidinium_carterae.1